MWQKKQLLWLFWHQRISSSFFRACIWHQRIYGSFLHSCILVKLKFLQTGKTAALVKIPFYETCFSLTRLVVHIKQWHDWTKSQHVFEYICVSVFLLVHRGMRQKKTKPSTQAVGCATSTTNYLVPNFVTWWCHWSLLVANSDAW